METPGWLANQIFQAGLDIHVHVFKCRIKVEFPGRDLFCDARKAVLDRGIVCLRDNALRWGPRQTGRPKGGWLPRPCYRRFWSWRGHRARSCRMEAQDKRSGPR